MSESFVIPLAHSACLYLVSPRRETASVGLLSADFTQRAAENTEGRRDQSELHSPRLPQNLSEFGIALELHTSVVRCWVCTALRPSAALCGPLRLCGETTAQWLTESLPRRRQIPSLAALARDDGKAALARDDRGCV